MAPRSRPSFDCSLCLTTCAGASQLIDSSPVCQSCIVDHILPKFHAALKYESQYPAKWSEHVILSLEDFKRHFSPQEYRTFSAAWKTKIVEYSVAYKLRVYCKDCETFVTVVCGWCGNPGHDAGDCDYDDANPDVDPVERVSGFKRCPNEACKAGLFLYDGCNEVNCGVCRGRFCWVCLVNDPAQGHWAPGKPCPRFGKAGDRRAVYDRVGLVVMNAGPALRFGRNVERLLADTEPAPQVPQHAAPAVQDQDLQTDLGRALGIPVDPEAERLADLELAELLRGESDDEDGEFEVRWESDEESEIDEEDETEEEDEADEEGGGAAVNEIEIHPDPAGGARVTFPLTRLPALLAARDQWHNRTTDDSEAAPNHPNIEGDLQNSDLAEREGLTNDVPQHPSRAHEPPTGWAGWVALQADTIAAQIEATVNEEALHHAEDDAQDLTHAQVPTIQDALRCWRLGLNDRGEAANHYTAPSSSNTL